jgi:hypothetical protein
MLLSMVWMRTRIGRSGTPLLMHLPLTPACPAAYCRRGFLATAALPAAVGPLPILGC